MARWTDIAEWRGPTVNEGDGDGRANEPEDRAVEQRGAVLHIADGYYDGTIAWQRNDASDVSSQFVVAGPRDVPRGVPDGRAAQVVDTDIRAWTQRDGNGHWISIECSGFSGDALSAAQIETCARIFARGHQVYGYPLQLATSPTGRGLGHHSMGTNGRSVPTDTWTGASWGHEQCPGPRIVGQKAVILARAIEIVSGTNHKEDDMTTIYIIVSDDPNHPGGVFTTSFAGRHWVRDVNAVAAAGGPVWGSQPVKTYTAAQADAVFGEDIALRGAKGEPGPATLEPHGHRLDISTATDGTATVRIGPAIATDV